MKWSSYFLPTLKEIPKEAETKSHKLMLRAGLIRKVASGVYSYLPFGLRALRKVEKIIREEMDNIGGLEVSLPILIPSELWRETGRWVNKKLFEKDRIDSGNTQGVPPKKEPVLTLNRNLKKGRGYERQIK